MVQHDERSYLNILNFDFSAETVGISCIVPALFWTNSVTISVKCSEEKVDQNEFLFLFLDPHQLAMFRDFIHVHFVHKTYVNIMCNI